MSDKTIVLDGQGEDPVEIIQDMVNNKYMFHGYATAKHDYEFSPNINAIKDEQYSITAWLPEQDITCIWIDKLLLRMDVETFNENFRKTSGL